MNIRNAANEGLDWLKRQKPAAVKDISRAILGTLVKQNKNKYRDFIKDRSDWLISKRQSGGWTHIATSNLAIQALILAVEEDIAPSIQWLLEKQSTGNWGNINSTSLSLISLKMHLDCLHEVSRV